jgi:aldehyde dehydrogenase (NAD+)
MHATAAESEYSRVFRLQGETKWAAKASDARARKEKLEQLKRVVLAHRQEVIDALRTDLRKSEAEASGEVNAVVADIDLTLANLDQWMRPTDVESSPHLAGTKAMIVYEPRGICLLFGPWNFPFQLLFSPLVPMIAAGNCAIVKPNDLAPATSRISARIAREAFGESDVAVFEGGIDVANALLELAVDHIFFTGSPNVGRTVMGAAARHLASVTLELGGKCPAIVDRTADLKQAAQAVGSGRCKNAGQVCLSPDIAWVHEDQKTEFLAHLEELIGTTYYQDGTLDKSKFGTIVDGRNFTRVKAYIDDALERGARLAVGGTMEDDRTIHPAVLVDVPLDAAIMHEEVFGPILTVMTYTQVEDITRFMRKQGKPLAMYVFSKDQAFIDHVLLNSSSGGVTINGWAMHYAEKNLPFGGVNGSGMGAYHGVHGFKELSHQRSVLMRPAAD